MNNTLPIEINLGSRKDLEQFGVVFGKKVDDLFVEVQLPDGWSKVAIDHSMGSKLLDEKGRERASIFYKAAFYDRRADMTLRQRFSTSTEPINGWMDKNYKHKEWVNVVKDCDTIIWRSELLEKEPDIKKNREKWLEWLYKKNNMIKLGKVWLDEHYLNWKSYSAYWD